MPPSKNSLKRFKIEDRLLSDPSYDYTTEEITKRVNAELSDDEKVTQRMIQKDIKALEEEFGKMMERGKGGRGTVRYMDQSTPVFYQQLTLDEERLLREVLKTLGHFTGLDNFVWLDLLKKKLDLTVDEDKRQAIISFSKNEGLQMSETLIGRLFTAISRRQVIRVVYARFEDKPQNIDIYPYRLKQFNDRWFLLATPLENGEHPYNPVFILNLALDRIQDFSVLNDRGPYIDTSVDMDRMYDEIVGVTLDGRYPEPEDIYFAVKPASADYIRTKWIHSSQIEITGESKKHLTKCYPSLKGCAIFSVCCRMNTELIARFLSYGPNLIVFNDPDSIRSDTSERLVIAGEVKNRVEEMMNNYRILSREASKLEQDI